MKGIFLPVTALAIIGFIPWPAAIAEEAVKILPRWKQGEKVRLERIGTRQRMKDGKVTSESAPATTAVELEVLKAMERGYLLAWTWGESKFDNPREASNPFELQMANLLQGLRMVIEVDSDGAIGDVRNWRELKSTSDKMISTAIAAFERAGVEKDRLAKVEVELKGMFETKERAKRAWMKEIGLYFLPLGLSIDRSKPVAFDDELPNLFGGDPFPTKAEFGLKAYDKASGRAIITWKQTPDPEKFRTVLEKTLKDTVKRAGGQPIPEAAFRTLTFEDTAEFTVDVPTGWVHHVTHTRTFKADGVTQEDRTVIKLLSRD